MRDVFKVGLTLLLITAFAGLTLGMTNAITAEPIRKQADAAAIAARQAVLPDAAEFTKAETDAVEEAYQGYAADGAFCGGTAKVSVRGYGGPIEVTVGMDAAGRITTVHVGGADFSETAGLGAKTKDVAFTEQFMGQQAPVALAKDGGSIDAVSAATISSAAVVAAVNQASAYLLTLIQGGH